MISPKLGKMGLAANKHGIQGGDLCSRVDCIYQSQKCFKQRSQVMGPHPNPSGSVLVQKTTIVLAAFRGKHV